VVSANVRGPTWVLRGRGRAPVAGRGQDPGRLLDHWGGQFENLQSATQRLQIVVPVALLLVFVLLFAMFGNVKDGLLVFTGIPFALTGGILALGCVTSRCRSRRRWASSRCPGWRCSTGW
jgi:cobalt-zinc-cadmium resistance protein CzcA